MRLVVAGGAAVGSGPKRRRHELLHFCGGEDPTQVGVEGWGKGRGTVGGGGGREKGLVRVRFGLDLICADRIANRRLHVIKRQFDSTLYWTNALPLEEDNVGYNSGTSIPCQPIKRAIHREIQYFPSSLYPSNASPIASSTGSH